MDRVRKVLRLFSDKTVTFPRYFGEMPPRCVYVPVPCIFKNTRLHPDKENITSPHLGIYVFRRAHKHLTVAVLYRSCHNIVERCIIALLFLPRIYMNTHTYMFSERITGFSPPLPSFPARPHGHDLISKISHSGDPRKYRHDFRLPLRRNLNSGFSGNPPFRLFNWFSIA